MEEERKKFYKKLISNGIFFNNVTFIKTSNPALCREKEFVLNLYTNDILSSILF